MAVLPIAEYRIAQDRKGGFVTFKVRNPNGSISGPVGGKWIPVPFAEFASLVTLLATGNAIYDDSKGMFGAGSGDARLDGTEEIEFVKRKGVTLKASSWNLKIGTTTTNKKAKNN